jgi:hypothetical protein
MFPISVLAYLAFILLLAGGPGVFKPQPAGNKLPATANQTRAASEPAGYGVWGRWLGLAGPWAAFLFLPNDSLPPFLDFAWSGPAFWLGLLLEPLVRAGRGFRSKRPESRAPALKTLFHLLILILAWLCLCFYASKRGLPGALPGLSVFAATPLLSQAGPAETLALIGLFLALSPFAARREADSPGLALTRLAISAFLITAFFPFSLSGFLETSAPLALDFFLFWGKVLLLNRFWGLWGRRPQRP